MGNVVPAGEGQAPARQAAIAAGVPDAVGALTINKVCGSGLKAVMLAAAAIRAGDGDFYVAGGMESMNLAPYLLHQGALRLPAGQRRAGGRRCARRALVSVRTPAHGPGRGVDRRSARHQPRGAG